jgi:hypothetical protein
VAALLIAAGADESLISGWIEEAAPGRGREAAAVQPTGSFAATTIKHHVQPRPWASLDTAGWRPWPRILPMTRPGLVTSSGSASWPARTCPTPTAPIQQALPHMSPEDRAETIAILGRLDEPDESTSADLRHD